MSQTLRTVGNLSLCDANLPLMIDQGVLNYIDKGMKANMKHRVAALTSLQVVKNFCCLPDSDTTETDIKVGGRGALQGVAWCAVRCCLSVVCQLISPPVAAVAKWDRCAWWTRALPRR